MIPSNLAPLCTSMNNYGVPAYISRQQQRKEKHLMIRDRQVSLQLIERSATAALNHANQPSPPEPTQPTTADRMKQCEHVNA